MSEYFFAASNLYKPPTATVAQKRDRIARRVGGPGCGYTRAKLPEGIRAWGYCQNRGEPFDRQTAAEIQREWGLCGVGGPV